MEVSIFLSFFIKFFNFHYTIRCVNRDCRRQSSIKTNTFWENSSLPVWKQVCILVYFLNDSPIHITSKSLGITQKTVGVFYGLIRRQVVKHLATFIIHFDKHGGEYEVDEFLVKNVKGGWHKCCWVAGIVERGSGK